MRGENGIKRGAFLSGLVAATAVCPLLDAILRAEEKGFRLLDHPRIKRDFADKRSFKVLFLAHCLLNMNARMHKCANVWPAVADPLIDYCREQGVGLVQMPCPELMTVGLGRDRDEPEQEYLRQALEMQASRDRMRDMAAQVVYQMKEYRFQGFRILGVLGSEGSPSCGVSRTHDLKNEPGPGRGVFIQVLLAQMDQASLKLPVFGNMDGEEKETLAWLEQAARDGG